MSDDKSSKDDKVGGLSRKAYWQITESVKPQTKQDSPQPDEKPDDLTPEI